MIWQIGTFISIYRDKILQRFCALCGFLLYIYLESSVFLGTVFLYLLPLHIVEAFQRPASMVLAKSWQIAPPDLLPIATLKVFVILFLYPQRHQRGNVWWILLGGLTVFTISFLALSSSTSKLFGFRDVFNLVFVVLQVTTELISNGYITWDICRA